MLLVLTPPEDSGALSVVRAARALGAPCTVVTPATASFVRHRSHRISDSARSTRVELADGTVLTDAGLSGVLNRLTGPPALAWGRAAGREREYATAELHAFTLAWLTSLPCPVRNRPSPEFLAGPRVHPLRALAAAGAAGLTCPAARLGPGHPPDAAAAVQQAAVAAAGPYARARHLVCLDGSVVADHVPDAVRSGLTRLLAALDLADALVGADFLVADGTWWFVALTALPDLQAGGPPLVDRLLAVLGTTAVPGVR